MVDYKQNSMVDIAVDVMLEKKAPVNFYDLYEEIAAKKEYNEEEKARFKSLFYTDLTLDGRLITVGENYWDLRSRHKFEEVHIDMNDIYADDEESNESSDEDDDDGLIEDDYN